MKLAAIFGLFAVLAVSPANACAPPQAQQTEPPSNGSSQEAPAAPEPQKNEPKSETPQVEPQSPPAAENATPVSAPKPSQNQASPAGSPATKKPAASRPKANRKGRKAAAPPADPSGKVVVKNGSTTEPKIQLVPGLNKQQASQQLNNTNELLDATDANLKKISAQPLDATQQETVKQIKSYMQKAKEAVGVGDVQGARNLALKANLLSEELAKP